VLLGLLGVNVWCWVFYAVKYVVVGFTWQCVLYVLGGNVCCLVFMWQNEMLDPLCSKVCFWVF